MLRWLISVAALACTLCAQAAGPRATDEGIEVPLAPAGDAARGRALVIARDPANCILCHGVPDPEVRFSGNLAPSLAGAGRRLTTAEMRLRLVDSSRVVPDTIMPAYFRTEGLVEVAAAYRGKTILSAQQIEDLIAYLSTLK